MKHFLSLALVSGLCLLGSKCATVQGFKALRNYEITLTSSDQGDTTITKVTTKVDKHNKRARLLSAFFGLDDALPAPASRVICDGANGKDGMPVIFSHEIDVKTMQAGDFRVTTASGKVGKITCVTLAPADDQGELRTALLVGHYGSIEDQPAKVEIVGNILSIDHSVNFKGGSVTATKLEEGPTIILAEIIPKSKWQLGKKASILPFGGGDDCPVGTKQIVNATWAGGVTKPGGENADDKERLQYKVTVKQLSGKMTQVVPFALADLRDGDNNHKLCLDTESKAITVFFKAGYLTDPREDLNPDTKVQITQ